MEPLFKKDQRVKQISTGKFGTIKSFDEIPTTGTRFYHVQFDWESRPSPVAETDLQGL
jgi:hypothetical protein